MKKTLCIIMVLLLIVAVFTFRVFSLSAIGSRGEEVKQIQTALKEMGYYTGKIDGIFGTNTLSAVRNFQRTNGLKVDGIVGKKTLEALYVKSGSSNSISGDSNYYLLARLISAEARGEPYIGQVAVGAVVLNRVEHPSFPNTVTAVIYQPGAFSCLYDGQFNQPVSQSAYSAARDALNGIDPTDGAVYYYNPVTATNKWIRSLPITLTIGNHVFCNPT